jgi:NADH-quinone oxidoreductase subunit A
MIVTSSYFPFLVQAILAGAIACAIVLVSHLMGQRGKHSKIMDTAYECGTPSDGMIHSRFSVKFFVTALLFMLFDLEVVILLPWSFIYRDFLAHHVAILGPILFFFGVLVLGLIYEVKKGALEWEK